MSDGAGKGAGAEAGAALEKLETGEVTFGIVGLGYVGLPLAAEAARAGVRVLGFDVQERVVKGLNEGRSHIQDLTDADVKGMLEAGCFEATTELARLSECDAVSICVPTPLSKTRDPDVSYILKATEAVAGGLHPGQLVVLESTTYPGTTREIVLPELEASGLEVGEDFFLCFSPERVDPGNETWGIHNTPKVIGGVTPRCTEAGVALYSRFVETMVPVGSAEAAELTKLLENTFRAVNIGLVNEIALIADRLGVNVWEVIDAAASKPFGFMKFQPGPGLGGHCIPIDPEYLSWKMRTLNYRTRFIEVASEINSQMPEFVAGKVSQALNEVRKPVNGSRVVVLGVAYKPDVNDVRESPAIDVMRLLEADGADVVFHDPFVPRLSEDGRVWEGVEMTDELLTGADAVVIVTDHASFDYSKIVALSPLLVDARNATAGVRSVDRSRHPEGWIVKE